MKKISFYIMTLFAVVALTGCTEDYANWAGPQTNEQEAAKTVALQVANTVTSVDFNTLTTDSVDIAKVSSITLEEGGTAQYELYLGSDNTFATQEQLNFALKGDVFRVSAYDLEDAAWTFYGKHGQVNASSLRVYGIAETPAGQGTRVKGNDLALSITTQTLPIESAYYMVGDVNGWNQGTVLKFTDKGSGIFELVVDIATDKSNFKIIPQSGVDTGGDFWGSALGTATDGDTSPTGIIVYKRNGKEPGAICIAKADETKIVLDMNNYTYQVAPVVKTMYMIGSPWSWNWDNVGESMTAVNGIPGKFWAVQYFAADAEIKFCPVKAWNGDFGFSASNLSAETIAYAGLSDAGGNIKVGNAGWYIVVVSTSDAGAYTVEFLEPTIWLVGAASNGGWGSIAMNPLDKFTVPADGTGEFVSPAFMASDNLRISITLPNVDWWKTEFNIFNGKIEYRGNGGDQPAVPVTAGQKAYLKFSDGTGRVQ